MLIWCKTIYLKNFCPWVYSGQHQLVCMLIKSLPRCNHNKSLIFTITESVNELFLFVITDTIQRLQTVYLKRTKRISKHLIS